MADIDPTNPADNAIVSQYPPNERASRAAIETNLYLEHGIDVGRHKFGVGNDAARDAITNWFVGSFWLNTSRTPAILQRTISIDPDVWENVERTNAQVKTDYEANANTNEYSDTEQTTVLSVENGATADAKASQAEVRIGTNDAKFVTSLRVGDHQAAAKSWVNFNGTGVVAIDDSLNVTSITDNGVGDYTVNFTTAFANVNYSVSATSGRGVAGAQARLTNGPAVVDPTISAWRLRTLLTTGAVADSEIVNVIAFGDQ